ncbi:MAG: glycosyltransferase [Pelosinus sp.]|nr:glycosyltransferase [Pelosinus sp.]
MMRLSICMMVKNEEKYLQRSLQSLQALREAVQSELIIVDTGSTDSTVEIAKKFTDKVYYHAWDNDFSVMRNTTISYAQGEWIYIMDGDEILEVSQPLIDFLVSPKRKKYGAIAITGKNIVDIETENYTAQLGFRLFKNDGNFHYEGAVHNQAVFRGETLAIPEVYLLHYGYVSNDKDLMERKFSRTAAILKQELEKDPKNIYYWSQMSVTYAMHNDFKEAIEYAEKAYSLLPTKKTPNYMFVLLQLILVYQHEEMYQRVAEVCRESMDIQEGYVDVYYYYAESQAMTDNYPEAAKYFEKYLSLLEKRKTQQERDMTIIEYTLGFVQMVYYNLSRMLKKQACFEKALYYAEKVTDTKFVNDNLLTIMELYLALGKTAELRVYYDTRVNPDCRTIFLEEVAKRMTRVEQSLKLKIATAFVDLEADFGLLCRLIIDDYNGNVSAETFADVEKLVVVNLPVYCSDIFYYLLKWNYSLGKILTSFKEIWLGCAFDHIAKKYDDLCEVIYTYLQKQGSSQNFADCKLNKILARYALLLNKLDSRQYNDIFTSYMVEGISYIQAVYSAFIINNEMVYELKNDEEVFLLYIYYAKINHEAHKDDYARYLRLALQAFPEMKRGIEILLQDLQSENVAHKSMEGLLSELLVQLRTMIDEGNYKEAASVIEQGEKIVGKDVRLLKLKAEVFCKQMPAIQ